jgi:hypothetical protein
MMKYITENLTGKLNFQNDQMDKKDTFRPSINSIDFDMKLLILNRIIKTKKKDYE